MAVFIFERASALSRECDLGKVGGGDGDGGDGGGFGAEDAGAEGYVLPWCVVKRDISSGVQPPSGPMARAWCPIARPRSGWGCLRTGRVQR